MKSVLYCKVFSCVEWSLIKILGESACKIIEVRLFMPFVYINRRHNDKVIGLNLLMCINGSNKLSF